VVNVLDNWDSYPMTGNNYYLFNNSESGRFEWIPWDLSWGGDPKKHLFDLGEFGLVESAPLYDNAMQVERYRIQYAAYVDLLSQFWFNYENIYSKANAYHQMIAPHVKQSTGDKMFYGENAMFSIDEFNHSWQGLAEFARERQKYIQDNLSTQLNQNQ
ncbi:MAG: CotH kinase family protein, partial [Anaerolineaceae bacterium]|nr:CotH kinase family protein [Anaerolineaceae bacterium]